MLSQPYLTKLNIGSCACISLLVYCFDLVQFVIDCSLYISKVTSIYHAPCPVCNTWCTTMSATSPNVWVISGLPIAWKRKYYMHQWSEQAHQWVQHLLDMSHISQDRLITWSERPICFSKQVRDKGTGTSSVARLTKSTALPTAQEVSKWCKILWSVFMIFLFQTQKGIETRLYWYNS